MRFSRRELRDLLVAWLALGLAFTFVLTGIPLRRAPASEFAAGFAVTLVTVGTGFLLHELAHKAVAVRFGQRAAFRADYSMLFLAVMGGLVGFIFAAPGAVVHRGRITDRENGLIAVAGPLTNVALAAAFLAVAVSETAPDLAAQGVFINVLLAGFNMLPVGPLDGRTVLDWSAVAYLAAAVPTVAPAVYLLFGSVLL